MKLIVKLNIYFIYILFKNTFSFCKEGYEYENQEKSKDLKKDIFSSYDYSNDNSDIVPDIIYKKINPFEVQSELLFNEKIYIFNFTSNTEEKKLIIHFYPLDCQIKISGEYENENYLYKKNINIERISNYENDAFYAIIESNEIKTTEFKIKILINSIDDYNNNRTYHLLINSLEYINEATLNIKEIVPTFLYFKNTFKDNFNNNINNINLLYKFNGKREYPISLYFFIKERVKFNISVSNNKTTFRKTIAYSDRILIDTDFFPKEKGDIITISIEKIEKEKNAVLIAKIVGDYETPKYFQKNILNIEFIPTDITYQYFYIEVFNGELGEIVLNNKRYDGILMSSIIKKEQGDDIGECNILYDSKCYPTKDEENIFFYNEYSQTLYFESDSDICEDGCYLLITYFSRYLNKKNNIQNIKGTEFSLLSRIVNQKESNSHIINIPLNEYIFGTLEYIPINNHYYSVYIPDNEAIILEIHQYNIDIYSKDGAIRYNINIMNLLENVTENGFIELDINSYESRYITFAFNKMYSGENSQYYFRILRLNTSNPIYPLDTTKENLCKTALINGNYSCFFLVKNTYKDLYNELIINAYGNKKIKYYNAWFEKEYSDYYSIDVNELNRNESILRKDIFFNISNRPNIDYSIIEIQSDIQETLNILTTYYDKKIFFPSFQIYSYQLFYLSNETNHFHFHFDFYLDYFDFYRIIIRNWAGSGKIFFSNPNTTNLTISGNKILSFYMTKEMGDINFNTLDNLAFSLKMDYELQNGTLKELNFHNEERRKGSFPMVFYLKEIENKGADINFYFDFNNNYNKDYNANGKDFIKIYGYIVDFEDIKYLNTISEELIISILPYMIDNKSILGSYDEYTNNGFIAFNEEDLGNTQFGKDIYYLIVIDSNTRTDFNLEALPLSKDNPEFSIPINKYISGSFFLKEEKKQSRKYYIQDEIDNNFIIELSSNYKNIKLIFNENIIKCENKTKEGGFQKYFIYMNYSSNKNENYFEISTNNKDNEIFHLDKANYILRYYYDNNNQAKKYQFDFSSNFELNKKSKIKNSYNLQIKNQNQNINEIYEVFYFLSIYDKKQIEENELINTVAPIASEKVEFNKTFFNHSLDNITYHLYNLSPDEEYTVSFFIKIKNKDDQMFYYTYYFEISTKKESKLLIFLIIGLSAFIVFLIICFIFSYRRFKIKNKNLKEQVQAISFSSGIDENIIDKNKKNSKDDDDYETTFI